MLLLVWLIMVFRVDILGYAVWGGVSVRLNSDSDDL